MTKLTLPPPSLASQALLLVALSVSLLAPTASPAATYTWNAASGVWDTTTTNWTGAGTTWVNGNDAVFGGTAGSTITINSPGISATSLLFNVNGDTIAANNGTLTLTGAGSITVDPTLSATMSAPIAGTVGLTKLGTGTLTLSGVETYSGATAVSAGVLNLSGTANYAGTTTISNGATLNLSGVLSGTTAITVNSGGTLTQSASGMIGANNAASLTVAGTATLAGASGYSGTTTINSGGVLNMQHMNALGTNGGGTTVQSGGALQFQGNLFTRQETFTLSGTGIANDGALRNISGVTNFHGSVAISGAGAVRINSDAGILIINPNNGTSWTNGSNAPLIFGGAGNISQKFVMGGTGSVTKDGGGTLTLLGANSYTGGTNINGGALVLGNGTPFGATGNVSFGGGTLRYSSSNTADYSGRFITTGGQPISIDTNSQNVAFATALQGSGTSLTKLGLGMLTLSAAPTYTGGTTVSGGTLLLSGANNMPATGSVTVNGGGTFSLADGTARNTTAASLNLASGATLVFDWNAAAQDNLASTAAATAVGVLGIQLNNTSPTGAGGTLLSSSLGGLTSGGASYYLANNNGYTATISAVDTAVSVGAQTTSTAFVSNSAYWFGNKVAASNVSGVDNAMALSSGTASNWSTTVGSYTSTAYVPTSTINAVFSATGATQQSNIVLGADMTLNTVTFNDTTAVTINGPKTLRLNGTGTGASSAISTNQNATINADLFIGAGQTWTTASGKTLTVGGNIGGTAGLTIAGAGTVTLTGTSTYTGSTTVNGGATLNYDPGSVKPFYGANNLTLSTGTVNVAGGFVDISKFDIAANSAINVSAGTLNARTNPNNGGNGTITGNGMINVTGGTVFVSNDSATLNPGNGGGIDGRWEITSGLVRISSGALHVGGGVNFAAGEITVTGGVFSHPGSAATQGGSLFQPGGGSGTNVINVAGGLLDNDTNQVAIANSSTGTSIFNLNAGTLYSKEFTQGTGNMALLNFNGGTYKMGSTFSTGTNLTPTTTGTSSFSIYLNGAFGAFTGGAVIDTNGFNATIPTPLQAPTGIGVTSLAVGSGGTGYVGAPVVTISDSGVGALTGTSSSGSNTITGISAPHIANMLVGQSITGTGIPAGSIITAVDAGAGTVTISQNATGANSGLTVRGRGATAYATFSGGAVTGFVVTNPGVGYVGTVSASLAGGTAGTAASFGTINTSANSSGGLTKIGAGTLTLTGDGTYTGTTTINTGTLQIGNAGTTGSLGGGSAIVNNAALIFNRTNTLTQGTNFGAISGPGTVTQSGTGTTVLNVTNTYTGVTTINAGVLQLDSPNALPGGIGVSGGSSPLVFSGGVLGLGSNNFQRNLGTVMDPTAVNFTSTGGWAAYGADRAVNLGGASASVTWATANTGFNGQLLVLGAPTATHTVDLQNPINLTNATRTVRTDDGSAVIDGKMSGIISGVAGGNFTKTGTGTLELSANNTYSGTTTISAGTLIFSGANFGSASAVSVSAGAIGQFNSLLSIPSSGRTVTDTGTVVFGPAFGAGNIPAGLLRITTGSAGAVAADNYAATNFDFQAAGLTAASLGAVGNVTYTGTLTPNGTTYRLGGGGGTLTMANTNALTGANAVAINSPGTVILAALNNNTGVTTINASATLQLGTGVTGQNGSVGGHIVNNGTLLFNNFDSQTYDCIISGTGSLTKNGAGTLTLTSKQTYAGTSTVNAGTLALAGGDNTLAGNKTLAVNGGTLDLGTTNQYVGAFTGTSGSITATGGTFTTNAANGTFSGGFNGSINVVKAGANTLSLTNANATTGTISSIGGGVTLIDGGTFANTTAVNVKNATLTLNNTGTVNNNNRVNDSASVNLEGGTVAYSGRASTASTETLGDSTHPVTANTGMSAITATPGASGSAELTMGSVARTAGATLRLDATNLGTAGNNGRIFVAGGIASLTGTLTPVNGVIPGVFRATNGTMNGAVGYVDALGFGTIGTAGGFPATFSGAALNTAIATSNVVGATSWVVKSGGQTINSLNRGSNITFLSDSDVLVIGSGMTWQGSEDANDLGVNGGIRGQITSGTGELFWLKTNEGSGTGPSGNINSVITDNGPTRVKFVIAAFNRDDLQGQRPFMTANNIYTGGTTMSGGNTLILGASTAGWTTIPAANDPTQGLIINNSPVVMQTTQGQIAATNIVTLNGGSTLTLFGNNTLAGIVFNSNGGTANPTVSPVGVLTISGNISSTPTNVAVTPIISGGTLDWGFTSHDITVAALPQGNLGNSNGTLTPLNGLTISSLIQGVGGMTKKGAGVLNLTGANTFSGQLTVEEGVLNVASVNNVSSNGVLGNSALAVIMGGSGNKTGTLEYTGGTTSSSKPFTMATGGSGGFQVDAAATNLTLSGVINGSGGLIKTGQGTLTLTNSFNVYNGGTIVNAGTLTANASGTPLGATTGTLEVSNPNIVSRTTAVVLNLSTSAVTTTGTLSGFIDCPQCGNTATINVAANQLFTVNQMVDATYEGIIAGGATSAFTLGNLSTSKLILTGNSTYDGPTNVLAGTLLVNGNNSAANGNVTVAPAGTLGGTGIIGGHTNVLGTHSPGNSPGIETFVGNLTYSGGASVVNWELIDDTVVNAPNPNALFDTILVGGNLDFAGLTALVLDFDNAGTPEVDWTDSFWTSSRLGTNGWLLYDVAGTTSNLSNLNITVTNWQDGNGALFNTVLAGSTFSLIQDGQDVYLNFTAAVASVPEPGTFALAALGLVGLACYVWRRRR